MSLNSTTITNGKLL